MLPGVSKTAILTLRARADEQPREDRILIDPLAAQWFSRIAWPAELDSWYSPQAQDALAFRAHDIDQMLIRFAQGRQISTITELGCGLSTRRSRLTDIQAGAWVDVDLPEVIEFRISQGMGADDHHQIPASVLDFSWMDQLSGDPTQHLFIIEGLLYYLPKDKVDELFGELRRRFAGSVIIKDVLGANDYPELLKNTTSVGSPIQWSYGADFDAVLSNFALEEVPEFEAERLMQDMLQRYWHRFDNRLRGMIFWAKNTDWMWKRRSGMLMGRLTAL